MCYPVMTEWLTATNHGAAWHKLFQCVRYHEADVLEFERQGAWHW